MDIQTRYGPMRVIRDDKWVSRSLIELGEHSEAEVTFLQQVLGIKSAGRLDGVVVEAGAYIGDITIPLSRCCRTLYAFEPQDEIREILEHNLRVNGCTNVTVFPCALGDKLQTLKYRSTPQDNSPGSTQMGDPEGDAETRMITLDSLQLERLDLLKADVEGMEPHVIAGGLETLSRTRSLLFMERDTVLVEGEPSTPALMERLGYNTYIQEFPFWNERNFNGKTANTFGYTVAHMVFGIPMKTGVARAEATS